MSEISCALEAERLMIEVRSSFRRINDDEGLTEADRKQLKDFYLQHMIAPNARKLLEKHFSNELRGNSGQHHRMTPADRRRRDAMRNSPQPKTNTPNRPASPDRNNTQDR